MKDKIAGLPKIKKSLKTRLFWFRRTGSGAVALQKGSKTCGLIIREERRMQERPRIGDLYGRGHKGRKSYALPLEKRMGNVAVAGVIPMCRDGHLEGVVCGWRME